MWIYFSNRQKKQGERFKMIRVREQSDLAKQTTHLSNKVFKKLNIKQDVA